MALTLEQRRGLAMAVLEEVSNLFEFWHEKLPSMPEGWHLEDVDPNEAAQVVANWLAPLPTGDKWVNSLPLPSVKS